MMDYAEKLDHCSQQTKATGTLGKDASPVQSTNITEGHNLIVVVVVVALTEMLKAQILNLQPH